jgi:proteasome regulatory subunit
VKSNNSKEKVNNYSYSIFNNGLEEENRILKETVGRLKSDLDRLRTPPLMVCDVSDIIDGGVIVKVPNGNKFFVNSSEKLNLKAGDVVLADQKNLNVIRKINTNKRFDVSKFVIIQKPDIDWINIGGLNLQINEIQEIIELPLKKPELFKKVGITPPKGILLHGPPGTGKTLLAKAVAKSTNSTFIEIVGSELVQKYIGEGAKLVKEIFEFAKTKAPAIVYIDEIDALAARRVDVGTSGEREVQRTFMQLLAELDGFKPLGQVKIIGCTNRLDILDPAITRPGRLDRLIMVPHPNKEGIKEIFNIHTSNMNLHKKIDIDKICSIIEGFSGAEIRAVCTEAGYFAIRDNRVKVNDQDFLKAIKKVKAHEEQEGNDYMNMFG